MYLSITRWKLNKANIPNFSEKRLWHLKKHDSNKINWTPSKKTEKTHEDYSTISFTITSPFSERLPHVFKDSTLYMSMMIRKHFTDYLVSQNIYILWPRFKLNFFCFVAETISCFPVLTLTIFILIICFWLTFWFNFENEIKKNHLELKILWKFWYIIQKSL